MRLELAGSEEAGPGGSSPGRKPAGQVSRRWVQGAARPSRSYRGITSCSHRPLSAAPPARFTISALEHRCQAERAP